MIARPPGWTERHEAEQIARRLEHYLGRAPTPEEYAQAIAEQHAVAAELAAIAGDPARRGGGR